MFCVASIFDLITKQKGFVLFTKDKKRKKKKLTQEESQSYVQDYHSEASSFVTKNACEPSRGYPRD
jgi:hypothetical protein